MFIYKSTYPSCSTFGGTDSNKIHFEFFHKTPGKTSVYKDCLFNFLFYAFRINAMQISGCSSTSLLIQVVPHLAAPIPIKSTLNFSIKLRVKHQYIKIVYLISFSMLLESMPCKFPDVHLQVYLSKLFHIWRHRFQ